MRILVVQNSPSSGAGRLSGWLVEEGLSVDLVDGDELPPTLAGVDGVVLLGGGFMPDNDEHAPWLHRERALTREAIAKEIPLLGICLGEQVLALVAGGEVTASSGETERGSVGIDLTEAAAEDRVFSSLAGEQLRMIQNHKDSVTRLPEEAVLLGTNEACKVQAFRVGSVAWGLQFHPEVDASRLKKWNEASLAKVGVDRDALAAAAEVDAPVNVRQSRELLANFAAVVREQAAQRRPAA
ncbi:type 1 glutamine amidotransferase [Bogoriella caseilytica]|uniref:GMP synthase-like glutamine amidotransferase n=1 Tax=Bogoriella caseilytica TaxID=56055 RepID=A0A3N2BDV4_9MICO|nr:type 1 glutamine amidotransferase [Bogoriella caseilytica]ROR73214.1 GMP synthase-like glutamine amidotransferase [Bogoriella caseilytica]